MKLAFENQTMLLANVNARSELNGEERVGAGDLKFEAKLPNDVLSLLHPSLKSALYHLDTGKPSDLVDAARRSEPGYLPHLRFPEIGSPIKWDVELPDVAVEITPKGGKLLTLAGAKLNNVSFVPLDGGTVEFSFRIQAHPDEKQFGKLCAGMIQTECSVTVKPSPDGQTGQLPGTEPPPA